MAGNDFSGQLFDQAAPSKLEFLDPADLKPSDMDYLKL
jgi:hypothetical protein